MSADNRICYMQDRYGRWGVWHGSGSSDYFEPPADAEFFDTEEERDWCIRRMEGEISYLEYGTQRITAEEQEKGLIDEIKDLQARLRNLRATGTQFPPPSSHRR